MPSMLDATPEEQQQLRLIAAYRAMGLTDEQIFGPGSILQAGGYGLLPYVADFAGINSAYNLGRGTLAEGQQSLYYDQVRHPYNVVAATQYLRDTGASPYLTDPELGQVQASPASRYGSFIDSLLFPPGEAGVTGGQPQTATNPTGQQLIDAWRAYHPGQPDPVPGYATNAMNTGAQQRAARSLSPTLPGMTSPQFSQTLAQGKVPGFSSFNEAEMGRLSPDQRAQYFGLVGSTGRVSDPLAAYEDFQRRYATRGGQAAGTYR